MGARTIPDGAGITNHFSASFAPHVSEAGYTSLSGLKDEISMVDGPDGRGYITGKPTRQTLTLVVPSHDPAASMMHAWKEKCEHGTPGYKVTGTVTVSDVADNPVAIYELEDCICFGVEANDLTLDGGEVAIETFQVSYSRKRRIGP
jgi:hypothetical protein